MVIDMKKIYGKGIYNKCDYTSRKNGKKTDVYNCWIAMLQRCYDPNFLNKHPSYIDCTVCEDWLDFKKFTEWFEKNYIKGFQLDKDILIKGNKTYSPDTCCFIPQEININIIKPFNIRNLPLGVYKHYNKYVSYIKENKVRKYIGSFNTIEEASNSYVIAKQKQLKELAEKYKNTIMLRTYNAVLNYTIN